MSRPLHATPLRLPEEFRSDLLFAMPAPLEPSFDDEVLADNPWLYWKLGGTDATTVTDLSGNGRHGWFVASPGAAPGVLVGGNAGAGIGPGYVVTSATGAFSGGGVTVEACFRLRAMPIDNDNTFPVVGVVAPTAGIADAGEASLVLTHPGSAGDAWHELSGVLGDGGASTFIDSNVVVRRAVYAAAVVDPPNRTVFRVNTLTAVQNSATITTAISGTPTVGGRGGLFVPGVDVERVALYASALSSARVSAHYAAFTRDQGRLSGGLLGTLNTPRFLGAPQQWVLHGDAMPNGAQPFTLVAVVQASLETTAGAQQAIVSTIDGSPVDKGGMYLRYTQNNVQWTLFNDVGSGLASLTVATSQTTRRTFVAIHHPHSRYAALYADGSFVASVANPVTWMRQGSVGIGVRHVGATALQQFSGTIEQLYVLGRAVADWEVRRIHQGVVAT